MAIRSYGSLFERLAGESAKRAGLPHEQQVIASVAAHLSRMLSTRSGSVQTLPDYGLPDLNDMSKSLHTTLEASRAAIERFVEKYEPRLSGVSVTRQDGSHDSLRLLFAIEGVLEVGGSKRHAVFSVSLGASGEASVRHA